jgi:hypothetical protein
VHGQVSPVPQVLQHLVRHSAQPDLQGGPVVDEARDVAGDLLADALGRLVQVLGHGRVHEHGVVDAVSGDEAFAARARHGRVDLGDDGRRRQHGCPRDVDGDSEAVHAVGVRWCDLDEGHVQR